MKRESMTHILKISWMFLLFFSSLIHSQVNFTTSVSQNPTGIDDVLNITYTADKEGNFIPPKFSNFQLLGGPSRGQSSQVTIMQGKVNKTVNYSFTYSVKPLQTGKFQTPIASYEVDGKKYTSKPTTVTVTKESQKRNRRDPMEDFFNGRDPFEDFFNNRRQPQQPQIDNSEQNFFGKIYVSNSEPYIGEDVFVTYKLYTRYGNIQVQEQDFPTQQGVWSEEIKSAQNIQPKIEEYEGQRYYVYTIKKEILYPQKEGNLALKPFKIKAVVDQSFFNPGTIVNTTSSAPTLKVKSLPNNPPLSFSNQVGKNYKLQFKASQDTIKVDESIDFKLRINGSGNIKQLGSIDIKFPKEFETYDPETKQDITIANGTNTGWKEFNFLTIPRHPGKYIIEPVSFTFFDIDSKTYKTLTSDSIFINVLRPDGTEASSTFLASGNGSEVISKDISPIIKDINLIEKEDVFFNSFGFYTLFSLPIILSLGFILLITHKKKNQLSPEEYLKQNVIKIISQQFKEAEDLLKQGKDNEFNSTLLQSLYLYISKKLNIEVASLTKEKIKEVATLKQIDSNTISQLMNVIESAEFASYAPASQLDNENRFNQTKDVISKIESCLSPSKSNKINLTAMIGLLMLSSSFFAQNINEQAFQKANQFYDSAQYEEAINSYLGQIENGVISGELFYNLGNAYYRTNDLLNAILFYEKAIKHNPTLIEAKKNLSVCQSRLFEPSQLNSFPYANFKDLIVTKTYFGINFWAWASIIFSIISFGLIALYFYLSKKTFLYFSVIGFITMFISVTLAYLHYQRINSNDYAIVFEKNAKLNSDNQTESSSIIIPEGKKVKILSLENDSYHISYEGNEGWISKNVLKNI